MRESKFRFRNPVLESMEFIVNEDFNEEQYEGIRISGKTQIAKIRGKNEAGVKFHLKIGEKEPYHTCSGQEENDGCYPRRHSKIV